MKITIDIPDYDEDSGIDVIWEENAKYELKVFEDKVILLANTQGLTSIAKQMLYMAINNFPYKNAYIYFDSFFTKLDNIKHELFIMKDDACGEK